MTAMTDAKTERVLTRMETDLFRRLQARAAVEDRTMAGLIRKAVRKYLDDCDHADATHKQG